LTSSFSLCVTEYVSLDALNCNVQNLQDSLMIFLFCYVGKVRWSPWQGE